MVLRGKPTMVLRGGTWTGKDKLYYRITSLWRSQVSATPKEQARAYHQRSVDACLSSLYGAMPLANSISGYTRNSGRFPAG
jgi:hypothetical protein